MKLHLKSTLATTIVLLLAGGVGACSDRNQTAGQKVDSAVASTERAAEQMKSSVKAGAAEVKDAAGQAATATKAAISDAAITTAVNAELVKDSSLSALKIDVDTRAQRVVLSGTAPSATAKERATQLAQAVNGVVGVENRLIVK